jgi:hypothetical protein
LFKDILTSKSDAALRRNIINIASKSSSSINEMRRELSRFTKLPTMANLVCIVFKTEGRCQQIQVNETTQKKKHTTTLIFATELVFSLSATKLFRRLLSGKPGALPVCLLFEM